MMCHHNHQHQHIRRSTLAYHQKPQLQQGRPLSVFYLAITPGHIAGGDRRLDRWVEGRPSDNTLHCSYTRLLRRVCALARSTRHYIIAGADLVAVIVGLQTCTPPKPSSPLSPPPREYCGLYHHVHTVNVAVVVVSSSISGHR